ncbi:MAG: DUF2071 domain-containing protein [Phycisphaerales bacterium]|nr:DUF2071 domain-containing protein [Phycisphaerales bacterium]MCI0674829.1 DUF2071 domain-containing protein [Phycisphaerales bacterium]
MPEHERPPYLPQRPPGTPIMRMRWLSLLFAHWPVPVEMVRDLIPSKLEVDTFPAVPGDRKAWIGLVPFTMRSVLPWMIPGVWGLSDVPGLSAFHECNVRTYVTYRGEPGVWFFSLDAASRLATWGARTFWQLPYFHSRIKLTREGDDVAYSVTRNHHSGVSMRCRWRIGPPLPRSQPGELAHFLTERYMLFSGDGNGGLYRSRVWHNPWTLRAAELLDLQDGLVRAAGITLSNHKPLLHHADHLDVRVWPLERVT